MNEPAMEVFGEAELDQRRLRDALGSFVTGITIVTARDRAGAPVGVTIGSFGSLSLDPPLVHWSLGRASSSYPAFEAASHFAVHVLADDQSALAMQFARSGIDRFADVPWEEAHGIPLIRDAAAHFACRMVERFPGGDHVIFVGRVLEFRHQSHRRPLIFHQGGMRGLAASNAL